MELSKKFLDKIINVTSKAAISCYPHLGKKDKILVDKAATDEMRQNLNKLDIDAKIVIGEGELDEAPMLYIGEKLGTGKGLSIDIAVDPLEGTNFAAKNLPGALSVISIALRGNLFNAPETYMDKLAVGKDVPYDATDLDFSIEKSKSVASLGTSLPTAILSIYVSGALNKFPLKDIDITDNAPGKFFAAKLVPSNGSTAISISGPFPVPSFSPI